MQPTILVVDDDNEIRDLLGQYLRKSDFQVHLAANGSQMMEVLYASHVDLIILDVMLPGDDGVTLCRRLRNRDDKLGNLSVLMLTARKDPIDRITGLEIGADDYLSKPFVPRELLARIRAVLRRARGQPQGQLADNAPAFRFGHWQLDCAQRELYDARGRQVTLTGGEYRLLRVFVGHPKRVLSRDRLLELTQGRDAEPFDRSIDVLVSRLRQRLRDDGRNLQLIKTVRGEGYVFASDVDQMTHAPSAGRRTEPLRAFR